MAKKSKDKDEGDALPAPNHLRCHRNDGKAWRCRRYKLVNHDFCQHHFDYAYSRSQKSKPASKPKPKSNTEPKPHIEQESQLTEPHAKRRVPGSKKTPGRSGDKTIDDATLHGDPFPGSDGGRRYPSRREFLKRLLDSDEESKGKGSNAKKRNVRECPDPSG